MIPFVLAAPDLNQLFGIIVIVVSVLSWLVNVIQGNTPDGKPRPQKQKPKPEIERSEIEKLLRELAPEKRPPRPGQRKESPQPQNPPPERARPKAVTKPQRPGGPPPYTPSRQAPEAVVESKRTSTPLKTSVLGGGVRSQQMSQRIDASVQQDITIPVNHDLGNRIAPASATQAKSVHPLVKVLREPNGVRQAILLNEILQRPKSLRH